MKRLVEVWLTKADKDDPAARERLQHLYARYKSAHYSVVVYQSGSHDLYRSTLDLLAHNRTRTIQREKASHLDATE